VLVLLEWSLFSRLKGVWVSEQCRMHVGRETEAFVKKKLIVSCLALFSPYMMPGQTYISYLDRYSIFIFRCSRQNTWEAPGCFEGHEEHRLLNFSENCILTNISVCHLPPIHTRLFPYFWGRIMCLTSTDLFCHEINCWFICIARHPVSAALVPLSDWSNNSTYCNRDISFLLFCPC
jgi:hypothetical protein